MTATETEIRGLAQKEIEVMRLKRALFEAAGLKVDELERKIVGQLGDAVAEDARQEFLKVETRKATVRTQAAYDALYETASGLLDAFMGVLGKSSEESKVLQRMRSRIRLPGDQTSEASVPEPTPVAQK